MDNRRILCLDFDGVIHSYASGWKGPRRIPDPPVLGALQFLVEMVLSDFEVHIYSSRSHQWGGRRAMKQWLYKEYLAIAGITPRKWFLGRFGEIPVTVSSLDYLNHAGVPCWYYDAILRDGSQMEPWEHEVHYGVIRFLKQIHFPRHKPAAFISIDDRALTFTGEWPGVEELLSFKPWNKKGV